MLIRESFAPASHPIHPRRYRRDWVRCEVRCLMCGRLLGRLLGVAHTRDDGDRSAGDPSAFLAYRPIDPPGPIIPYSNRLCFRCTACNGTGAVDDIELFSTYDDVDPSSEPNVSGEEPVPRRRGRPRRPFDVKPRGSSLQVALDVF